MGNITINGKRIFGDLINIRNSQIIVNGVNVTPDAKIVNITVEGDVKVLDVDTASTITITGDVDQVKTMSGSVDITGNVTGDVETMSGSVRAGSIGGKVSTMSGSIKTR